MSELKPGDRVKVEFEGVVVETPYLVPDGCVVVRGDASGTGGDEFLRQVHVSQCTLIEPEIVLPEVPGTIVQIDPTNKHSQRATYVCEFDEDKTVHIWTINGDWHTTDELVDECREFGYRVIEAVTE